MLCVCMAESVLCAQMICICARDGVRSVCVAELDLCAWLSHLPVADQDKADHGQ